MALRRLVAVGDGVQEAGIVFDKRGTSGVVYVSILERLRLPLFIALVLTLQLLVVTPFGAIDGGRIIHPAL